MLHGTGNTVLLIEADRSLRRLIALGLQYHGMHVIEASSPTKLPDLVAQQPGLVVLDIDGEARSDHSLLAIAQAHPYLSSLPIVLLAWDSLVPAGVQQDALQAQVTCLAKPFDARTLFATIEQVLDANQAISSISKEEVLLAGGAINRAPTTPTPSIWPLLTAVGLLLLFTGLMTQITISALGLLIVIVALLWWTLGTKTKHETWAAEIS
jgi:DNA-binding response OmpR family regulator